MEDYIVYMRANGARVKIGSEAYRVITRYRQLRLSQKEAGGVLLGRHIINTDDIVIDEVTVPVRGDIRVRCAFHRRSALHQQRIEQAWRESSGTCTYLGEWHTHPQCIPVPSEIDFGNWRERLEKDCYEGDSLFFVILGTDGIGGWEASKTTDITSRMSVELAGVQTALNNIGLPMEAGVEE